MPNGNYREDPNTANVGGANYRSTGRNAQGYPANTGSNSNYGSGQIQGNPQRPAASQQGNRQRSNAGSSAQGGQRPYSGNGQPTQNTGSQRVYYSSGQPAQNTGARRTYNNSGQPAQNGGSRTYYNNGQSAQSSGQRNYYTNNGQPMQSNGQRAYYSNGQPVRNNGQRTYSGNGGQSAQNPGGQRGAYNGGQPAQNPGGQRVAYNGGQPAQNPGGQRGAYNGGRPAQNPGGQRGAYNGGQPAQNPGGQRTYAQNGQSPRNAGGPSTTGARAEGTRPANSSERVAQGQVRRTLPPGSRTAPRDPQRRNPDTGRTRLAGEPPRNGGGRTRAGAAGSGRKPGEKKKKKKSVGMIILMVALLTLLGGLVFVVAFAFGKLSIMGRDLDKHAIRDVDDVYVDEHVRKDVSQANYTNILLVGIDSRDASVIAHANSDTMIVCSINNTTGKARLVSVYRDTYLNIMSPENVNKFQYNKANSAYNLGSAPQLLSMINANLDLNITDYVVVDFRAVMKLVDAVDGIDITLTDQEAIHLNNYQIETAEITGVTPQPVDVFVGEEPREYHLNGIQATAYCRIRYTNGWDMKRTQRQRLVIEKIIQKIKAGGIGTANRVLDVVLPLCYTSMNATEIIGMVTKMFSFEIEKTTGFPEIHLGKDISSEIMSAQVPVTLEENVVELHKWLFDIDSYETSQTVKDFSRQIILNTGYGPERREEAIADSEIGNSGGEVDQVK